MTSAEGHSATKTPTAVKLAIVGAGLFGLALMVGQFIVFFVLFNTGDFPSFFDFWDKIEVTYDNRTDTTAYVYIEDRLEVSVPAHSSVAVSYRKIEWWFGRRVEARDASGRVIIATKLDKDDLKDQGYRVVIDGGLPGSSRATNPSFARKSSTPPT